jgi:hypothetical protein
LSQAKSAVHTVYISPHASSKVQPSMQVCRDSAILTRPLGSHILHIKTSSTSALLAQKYFELLEVRLVEVIDDVAKL